MSDNIPFEIQMEIIRRLPVKPLIQFRSVSKPWKSFIDTSQFISGYGTRNTQPHSLILGYKSDYFADEAKFFCVVDDNDNNEPFKVQKQELAPFVMSPLLKQYRLSYVVDVSHGLLCLFGFHKGFQKWMVVVWNPSIGKSFGIDVSSSYSQSELVYGFGLCPVTSDPTIVKFLCAVNMPWHVEVFTLSSRVWTVIPSSNLPPESVRFMSAQVVIDRFIYWGATDMTSADTKYTVVSFDLITKEFKVVILPDSIRNELNGERVMVSKLRGSLVVYGAIEVEGAECCGVWVMEHDSSFRKLFTIGAPVYYIFGFTKSGEPVFETSKDLEVSTVDIYDPCSQQIKNLGISGAPGSFFMDFYKESLLLLDHPDLHIYSDDS